MNTQHLQYIIEIERTRSISQAAENLFIGQPNLSRILHDVEQMLVLAAEIKVARALLIEKGAEPVQLQTVCVGLKFSGRVLRDG